MSTSSVISFSYSLRYCFFTVLLFTLLCSRPTSATSYITVFSDSDCKKSFRDWSGPNGYPDGVCTSFSIKATGQFSSFMINELDPGCTVTIYTRDTTHKPCSGTAIAAEPCHCYSNGTSGYQYYSIDGCTPPDQIRSSSSSSSSPSTPPSSTPSAAAAAATASTPPTTAIIGASIGGTFALVALVTGVATSVWICVVRPRRRRRKVRGDDGEGEEAELRRVGAREGDNDDDDDNNKQPPDGEAVAVKSEKDGGGEAAAVVTWSEIAGAPILELSADQAARFELPAGGSNSGDDRKVKGHGEEGLRRVSVRGLAELPGDHEWYPERRQIGGKDGKGER